MVARVIVIVSVMVSAMTVRGLDERTTTALALSIDLGAEVIGSISRVNVKSN